MTVDFQKLQDDVSDIRVMLQKLTGNTEDPVSPPPSAQEELLTVHQAADLLDVTTATVYDLVHKRKIPSHKPGKRLYFLRSELIEWIKGGRRSTVGELTSSTLAPSTTNSRRGGRKKA